MLDELLKALYPYAKLAQGKGANLWGAGHTINTSSAPYKVMCAGLKGPNPDLKKDPTVEPTILIQHVLGEIQAPPGHDVVAFPMRDENGKAISNIPDDSWFTLAPGMTFDPENPVCPKCGQPFVL